MEVNKSRRAKARQHRLASRRSALNRKRVSRFEELEPRNLLAADFGLSDVRGGRIYAVFAPGGPFAEGPLPAPEFLETVALAVRDEAVRMEGDQVEGNHLETVRDNHSSISYGLAYGAELREKTGPDDIVLLVGHSIGGEKSLYAAAFASGAEIDLLATIDPVSYTTLGWRAPMVAAVSVPSNVDYFFNRWQENYPWPIDYGSDGRIDSYATYDDQLKQNDIRKATGETKNRGCTAPDYLKGFCKPFSGKTTTTRTDHGKLSHDDFIEQQLKDIFAEKLNAHTVIQSNKPAHESNESDAEHQVYSWDVQSHVFSWGEVDSPSSVELVVTRNGEEEIEELSGSVDPQGSVSFDEYGPGDYVFEVRAHAYNGAILREKVSVFDDDTLPPDVAMDGPTQYWLSDGTARRFDWNATDPSGVRSLNVSAFGPDGERLTPASWATGQAPVTGGFDFGVYGPGNYSLQWSAVDNDSDWDGDSKTLSTRTRQFRVYDDDTAKPEISFFASDGSPLYDNSHTESHGIANSIQWDIVDASGVGVVTANLYRNDERIASQAVSPNGQISLDSYGPGEFRLELTAVDQDDDGWAPYVDAAGNLVQDPSSRTASVVVEITNAVPEASADGPFEVSEGQLLPLAATGSDADPGDTERLRFGWDLNGDGDFSDAVGQQPTLSWEQLTGFGIDDDGAYPVAVRTTDPHGLSSVSESTLVVRNSAPQIVSIHADSVITENDSVTVTGEYADPSPADTHIVRVYWGDGANTLAAVDPDNRTFTATRHFGDDNPTGTSEDVFTIRVEVTDDDGAVNPPASRVVQVQTDATGAIELPAFDSSLPDGVSGRLTGADITIDPGAVQTSEAAGVSYGHTHQIDLIDSGSLFDFQDVTTTSTTAVGPHSHEFNVPATSATTITNASKFNGKITPVIAFDPVTEEPLTVTSESGTLPENAEHSHAADSVAFKTTTKFYYTVKPLIVQSGSFARVPSNARLNGNAFLWNNAYLSLTENKNSQKGSMVVSPGARKVQEFTANFKMWIGAGDGADGVSFGYAPLYTTSLFGETGTSSGLWVSFDTYDNGDGTGIRIKYNNKTLAFKRMDKSLLRRARWDDVEIQVVQGWFGLTRVIVKHPSLGWPGYIYGETYNWNPQDNWKFGVGARTGGLNDHHAINYLTIVDNDPQQRSYSVTETTANGYKLPKFNTSVGDFSHGVVTVDPLAARTSTYDAKRFEHVLNFDMQVGDYRFGPAASTAGFAGEDHSHVVDFDPVSASYSDPSELNSLFGGAGNTLIPQGSSPHFPAADGSHSHAIAAGTVPFHTEATFTYDAASALVRVQNAAPELVSVHLPATAEENSTVTLHGSFSDVGQDDRHTVRVDWGDGNVDEVALALLEREFTFSHLYLDDNPTGTSSDLMNVVVTVLDDDGGQATTSLGLVLENKSPRLAVAPAVAVPEGSRFAYPLATFHDVGTRDSHAASISWGHGSPVVAAEVREEHGEGVVLAEHTYQDEGVYPVALTLTDDDLGEATHAFDAHVFNVAPTIESLRAIGPTVEGAPVTFEAFVADPGDDALTYQWDFGDGASTNPAIDQSRVTHAFAEPGTYTVTLTVDDGDGGAVSQGLVVVVTDIATGVTVAASSNALEGSPYTLTLTPVTQEAASAINHWTVAWGDGDIVDYTLAETATHTFTDGPADRVVSVLVTNAAGGESTVATIPVHVLNAEPVVAQVAADVVDPTEGQWVTFTADAFDPGSDALTYHWDFGDGSSQTAAALDEVRHAYSDDGAFFVTLTVDDGDGGQATRSIPVLVGNVAPEITLSGANQTIEGEEYPLTLGAVTDPGDDTVTQWVVDWGDGQRSTYLEGGVVSHRFVDGGDQHRISVSLVDEDGVYSNAGELTVDVLNGNPVIHNVAADPNAVEGRRVSLTASVTDPAGSADSLDYVWDFGDGSPAVSGRDLFEVFHTYADNGDYQATLTVTDEDGGQATRSSTIVVKNQPPQASISGAASTQEAGSYALRIGGVIDPGRDAVTQWIVDWGDGVRDVLDDPSEASHVYTDGPLNTEIALSLVDEDGTHANVALLPVSVTNAAPVIQALTGDLSGDEGDTFIFQASASDVAGADDPLTYTWNFGDGSPAVSGVDVTSVSHTFADNGAFTVRLTVDDGDGGAHSRSLPVTVANVPPKIAVSGATSTPEGAAYALELGGVTDPGADTVTRWVVDWGDGQSDTYDQGGRVLHVYADGPAQRDISIALVDEDGAHVDAGAWTVLVDNAPPEFGEVVANLQPLEGSAVSFAAAATDPAGDADTLRFAWDFGDGSPIVTGSTASHVYADDGQYTATVTVSDEDGDSVSRQLAIQVGNVAPTAAVSGSPVVIEAETYSLTLGDPADPGQDEATHWVVDWGDGATRTFTMAEVEAANGTVTHVYANGPFDAVVSVALVDEDGQHTVRSLDVSVRNADPTITSFWQNDAVYEATRFEFAVTASDPADDVDSLVFTWDFGDGTAPLQGVGLTHARHVYADDGEYDLTVSVADGDGGSFSFQQPVSVANAAPSAAKDDAVVPEDHVLTLDVLANDTDPAGAADPLVIVSATNGSHGVVVVAEDGASLDYRPDPDFHGVDSFSYRIADGDGGEDTAVVDIVVLNTVDLGGRVFDDASNDGSFDASDRPLSNIVMELVRASDGVVAAFTSTNDDGGYEFDFGELLAPAGEYVVRQAEQPVGLLDGIESLGDLGGPAANNGAVNNTVDHNAISQIVIGAAGTQVDSDGYDFAEIQPSSLQSLVWEDFDNDARVDFGETAVEGVMIQLTGTDDRGNPVSRAQVTDAQGIVEFVMLRPGQYSLTETQPDGFVDGKDVVGQVNGSVAGDHDGGSPPLSTTDDLFTSIVLASPNSSGVNYNFGERVEGGQAGSGQTAGIGFWQNSNGQNLIASLNGSADSTLLAQYLADTLPNLYGALADSNGDGVAIDPMSNTEVAAFYQSLFKRNGKTSPGGPPKLDAQVMAVAIATYVTKSSFVEIAYAENGQHGVDSQLIEDVQDFGFQVTLGGVGSTTINVGDTGEAFGVVDDEPVRVIDLLLAADAWSFDGLLYDKNGDGTLDEDELLLRALANNLLDAVNEL